MALKSKVYFFFERKTTLPSRRELKKFIQGMFKREGKGLLYLNYIFCSDKKLLSINRKFLKHDYFTDVITFEFSEKKMPIEGEVYISVDRVKENASLLSETFNRELHRIIFHGVLHLCGYNDKSKTENKKMREVEAKYINEYFNFSRDTVS
jgi:probable rRNA maturation factor